MKLRPYQEKAIWALRKGFVDGHLHQILQLPTGGGKTAIASELLKGATKKDRTGFFLVDRLALVDQAYQMFYDSGMHVGVIQAQHPFTDYDAPVQVASIQTLRNRMVKKMDFCIIDEVHVLHKHHIKIMEQYPDIPFIGLSATPFAQGLGLHFTNLVVAETTQSLIDQNFLVPAVTYAPTEPDLEGVSTQLGDYQKTQLGKAMDKPKITGDIVDHWVRLGQNRQTLCFAVNVAHSKHIAHEFQSRDIDCVHIDAYTDSDERREIIRAFKDNKIKILSSVGVLTTGFDAPNASCLILARPTKSLMLHVQQIGRGLRPFDDKEDCLILDHAGNTARLGFATDPLPDYLDKTEVGTKKEAKAERTEPLPKLCPQCSYVKPAGIRECPKCGFVPEIREDVNTADGELSLVQGTTKGSKKPEFSKFAKITFYRQLQGVAMERGYNPKWAKMAYKKKFNEWPENMDHYGALAPGDLVKQFEKHLRIAYAKSRAKQRKAQS